MCKEVTDTPHGHWVLVTAVCSWGDGSEQLEASGTQKVAWVLFHFAYFESHKNSGQDNFFSTPIV